MALALAAPACGGERPRPAQAPDPARYRAEVTRISTAFGEAGRRLSRDARRSGRRPPLLARDLRSYQVRVRRSADALGRLRPPSSVRRPHAQLRTAFSGIARAAQPSIDAARAGDEARLGTALRRFRAQLSGRLGAQARTAAARIDRGLGG